MGVTLEVDCHLDVMVLIIVSALYWECLSTSSFDLSSFLIATSYTQVILHLVKVGESPNVFGSSELGGYCK